MRNFDVSIAVSLNKDVVEQTVEFSVNWDNVTLMSRLCNESRYCPNALVESVAGDEHNLWLTSGSTTT